MPCECNRAKRNGRQYIIVVWVGFCFRYYFPYIVFFVIPLNIVVLCVSQNIVVHQLLTSLPSPISGDCMESKITHRLHLLVIFWMVIFLPLFVAWLGCLCNQWKFHFLLISCCLYKILHWRNGRMHALVSNICNNLYDP